MITISVANAKGGVGKTTVSVNLAYELWHRKHKVAVVDLDSQCDLTKIFHPPDYKGPTIADALLKRCKISETMVAVEENLILVPGSREIAQINFKGSENALLRFSKVFEAKKVDFVVIDHPPSLHNVALAGFVASDHVLVVCQAEGFSISNLHQLMTDLNAIKKDFQPNLQILGIVMNNLDMRRRLTKRNIQECHKVFGKSILTTTISTDSAIANSLNQQIPVRKLHWYSRSITQFRDLADEVTAKIGR